MMCSSYLLGQKYYRIPYAVKKLTAYISICVLLYLIHVLLTVIVKDTLWFSIATGLVLLAIFTKLVSFIEAKELSKLPLIGKWYQQKN